MRPSTAICLTGLAAFLAATTGTAANSDAPITGKELVFEFGAAARVQPSYPGADSFLLYPAPIFKLQYLQLPYFGTVADARRQGLGFFPAFKVVGARSSADHAELTGLDDVDWALELGGGLRYSSDRFEAFAEVRRGVIGHDGFIGEFGLDGVARPTDRLTLKFGPRLTLADSAYMQTYFGVSAAESVASGLAPHAPGGGIRDIGVEFSASYAVTDATTLYADAGYRRLVGDAASSPIVRRTGSADQFTAGLGLTYRFSFDLDGAP